MKSILNALRLLADRSRLRILLLLRLEELSVAELQEVLGMGQSRISTHLSLLKRTELVQDRRAGKYTLYSLHPLVRQELLALLEAGSSEIAEAAADRRALELILRKRQDKARAYFDELAGRFGREYVPGRSWKGLAEALLYLMPPQVIADLGAGEGAFTQLLARQAERVIAVDNSPNMVAVGSELARKHRLDNVEFRLGDLETPPISDGSVDLAFFSQSLHHATHPQRAVEAAWRILRPGGRIAILDLKKHSWEEAREMYADLWLGFSELELYEFLASAGFSQPHVAAVHREESSPHFETVLAVAGKPR